jgi:hypothetical protein
MALGFTEPLTEMSTRCISLVQRRSVHRADNLTIILFCCLEIWEHQRGPLQACNGIALPLPLHYQILRILAAKKIIRN